MSQKKAIMTYQSLFNNIIMMNCVCVSKIIICLGVLIIGFSYNKNKEAEASFEFLLKKI